MEPDAVLQNLGQGAAPSGPHVADTKDTSTDESEVNHPQRRVRPKRTYKMKNVWGADEVGRFFVTGARVAAGKPSHFFCRICRKNVSVLTHGPHEVLRHFKGVKHFARDQRLRLETPGWRVLDLRETFSLRVSWSAKGSAFFQVIRDREYPFTEDLIVDDSGAPYATLPVLAKVPSLIEVLRLGGSYELVYQLWSQFTLTVSRMNIDLTCSRNEVLVANLLFHVSTHPCALAYWFYF